jgi:hypothetical protein
MASEQWRVCNLKQLAEECRVLNVPQQVCSEILIRTNDGQSSFVFVRFKNDTKRAHSDNGPRRKLHKGPGSEKPLASESWYHTVKLLNLFQSFQSMLYKYWTEK